MSIKGGLTTKYLTNLSTKLLKNFDGVFSCDLLLEIPIINTKMSLIVNLSTSNEIGSHFIAIHKNMENIEYFDSFGNECTDENIKKFIKKVNPYTIKYSTKCIQNMNSQFCGYFCLAFLLEKEHDIPMEAFLKKFQSKNKIKHDEISINIIQSYIRHVSQ